MSADLPMMEEMVTEAGLSLINAALQSEVMQAAILIAASHVIAHVAASDEQPAFRVEEALDTIREAAFEVLTQSRPYHA